MLPRYSLHFYVCHNLHYEYKHHFIMSISINSKALYNPLPTEVYYIVWCY